jgi:hypothetical protein
VRIPARIGRPGIWIASAHGWTRTGGWEFLGLATDIRLRQAPHPERTGVDNQALHINAFVIGGLQHSLGVVHSEEDLIAELTELRRRFELNPG